MYFWMLSAVNATGGGVRAGPRAGASLPSPQRAPSPRCGPRPAPRAPRAARRWRSELHRVHERLQPQLEEHAPGIAELVEPPRQGGEHVRQ